MEIIYHENRESAALTIIKTHHSYYRCEIPQTFWELASWYTFFPKKYSNLADEKNDLLSCYLEGNFHVCKYPPLDSPLRRLNSIHISTCKMLSLNWSLFICLSYQYFVCMSLFPLCLPLKNDNQVKLVVHPTLLG